MAKAASSPKANAAATSLAAHYTVRMPDPASHNFQVEIELAGVADGVSYRALPAWTPGSYKVRDFARNVSSFRARDSRGEALSTSSTSSAGALPTAARA